MHRSSFSCVFAVVALTAGCGSDEGDGEDPTQTGPIKLSFLLSDAVSARCDALVRCTWLPSKDLCGQVVSKDSDLLQLVTDAENGVVGYDPAAARIWVDALRAQRCDNTAATAKTVSDAFANVFIGRGEAGEACLVDGQCKDDLLCNTSMCAPEAACCAGLCELVTPTPVGSECVATTPCAEGSLCIADAMTGVETCTVRSQSGAMCSGDTCADGLACDAGTTGTCFKQAEPGEPCNPLLANACLDYTTWCSLEEEKCVPLPAVGEPCGTGSPQCAFNAQCEAEVCTVREYVGAPCSDDGGCMLDLYCSDGACFPAIQPVACGPIGQ